MAFLIWNVNSAPSALPVSPFTPTVIFNSHVLLSAASARCGRHAQHHTEHQYNAEPLLFHDSFLLKKYIDSRNLQPIENTGFGGSFFIEITHFFCKKSFTNGSKNEALRALVYRNDFCEQGATSMLPIYPGGHVAYQNFVVEQLRNHYANPAELPDRLLDIAERFWEKNLTGIDTLMQECYSRFGPKPRPPSCILRSVLLSITL